MSDLYPSLPKVPNWILNIVYTAIAVVAITVVIFAITDAVEDRNERSSSLQSLNMQLDEQNRLLEQNKVLVYKSGVPDQYTCEQIDIMIQSGVYPKLEKQYQSRLSPDEEFRSYINFETSNTKQSFVNYYLLNCVEQKQ